MILLTLRQVCEEIGVSRRAVQGYEKAGLVAPTGKNDRGHLLYDERAAAAIRQIKLYQTMGFTLKEIRSMKDASPSEIKHRFECRLAMLHREKKQQEALIQMLEKWVEELSE